MCGFVMYYIDMNEKLLWKIESLWNEYYRSPRYCKVLFVKTTSESITDTFFVSGNSYSFTLTEKLSFEKTEKMVFNDSYGDYLGIKNNQVIRFEDKLIYLFDNHNKFLVPLFHLYKTLERPIKVLHIDAHEDDALYQDERPEQFNEKVLVELLEKTRISDFYDSLSGTQIISEITRFTHSQDFENLPNSEYDILSLDIDIFGPEGDFAELEKKIAVIAAAMRQSCIVTIATSPGFIDQDFAEKIVTILVFQGK